MSKKAYFNSDERLNTMLSDSQEIRSYMSILGAYFIADNTFILGEIVLSINDNDCLFIKSGLTPSLKTLFNECGIPVQDNIIVDLETLVFLYTALNGETLDNCFENNLKKVKKEMLLQIFNAREKIDFNGQFANIDKVIAPFISDNFDIDRFIDECVFNTTGYYSERGYYDKCLKFGWRTKKDPDTYYFIDIFKNGYISIISFRNIFDRFYQDVYHEVIDGKEEISHSIGGNYNFTIDYKSGETDEVIHYKIKTKKTTEQDIEKMKVILESMVDKSVVFEKETPKINVKK